MTGNDEGSLNHKRMRIEEILKDINKSFKEAKVNKEPTTPIIKIEFSKCTANALIDTGADIFAVTKELYDELGVSNDVLDVLPVRKFILRGAFSERRATIANKAKLKFKYDNARFEHEFFIVERMLEKIILGIDFIKKFKMTMSYENETKIKFGNKNPSKFKTIDAITIDEAERELQVIFDQNKQVFSEGIGKVNHYRHEIKVKHNEPLKKKTYPIFEKHLKAVTKYIEEVEK